MKLVDFLTTIWGEGEGTVCTTFSNGEWTDEYWKYPLELNKISGRVAERDAAGYDCYFVPSILRGSSRKKLAFQSSNVAWVDLDGGSPNQLPSVPTALVETSPGHYHAYWRLEEPTLSIEALENVNRGLLSLSGADKSGVDATQLLRIPFTHSKKRDCPVVLKDLSTARFDLGALPKWNAPLLNLVSQS